MTFDNYAYSLAYIIVFTWIVGSITDSPGWALYFALLPFVFVAVVSGRENSKL